MDNTEYTTALDLFTVPPFLHLLFLFFFAPDEAHFYVYYSSFGFRPAHCSTSAHLYGVAIAGLILRTMEPSATLIMLIV